MLGAIIGDIIGLTYEFNPIKRFDFGLLTAGSTFTDDTVCTVAEADKNYRINSEIADLCISKLPDDFQNIVNQFNEGYFPKSSPKSGQLKMPQTSFQPDFNNKTTSVANDYAFNHPNRITSLKKNKVMRFVVRNDTATNCSPLKMSMFGAKTLILFIFLLSALPLAAQDNFYARLADSVLVLARQKVQYDPQYFRISYPNGDVPSDRGVCTDVIIRAYRKLGIDLQKEVHEDMKANFSAYPAMWGLKTTDTNIDHRRVPNLMKFFERKGVVCAKSTDADDYSPGDIVCWNLHDGIQHLGIVSSRKSTDNQRFLIVHNIGNGQVAEDCLFEFKIIGHYKYKK
jgi:uncharacterized protein YijF (DUF1287 family)